VIVIPANAGIQKIQYWIPICMGMTERKNLLKKTKKMPDNSMILQDSLFSNQGFGEKT